MYMTKCIWPKSHDPNHMTQITWQN
jgi:hypothetical protein